MERNWSEWLDLYGPVLIGFIFLALMPAVYYTSETKLTPYIFWFMTIMVFIVLGLHRAHEYQHGFTVGSDVSKIPSTLYAIGLVLFMIALRYDNPLISLLGAVVIVGTAYKTSRKSKETGDEDSNDAKE